MPAKASAEGSHVDQAQSWLFIICMHVKFRKPCTDLEEVRNGGCEKWPYTEFRISLMAHRKFLKHPSPSTESASRLFGSLLLARGQTRSYTPGRGKIVPRNLTNLYTPGTWYRENCAA